MLAASIIYACYIVFTKELSIGMGRIIIFPILTIRGMDALNVVLRRSGSLVWTGYDPPLVHCGHRYTSGKPNFMYSYKKVIDSSGWTALVVAVFVGT